MKKSSSKPKKKGPILTVGGIDISSREEWDRRIIDNAVLFTAHLRVSPYKFFREDFPVEPNTPEKREEAKQAAFNAAERIMKDNDTGGRGACVYAVSPETWTAFVDWSERKTCP